MQRPLRRNWQFFILVVGVIMLMAGIAAATLSDIAGHYAASAIAALQARGVLHGTGAERFEPDAPLTRAQMAKLLVSALDQGADARLLSAHDSRFTDVRRTHWAAGFVEALAEMGVTNGYPDGTFRPEGMVSRAELTVLLVRAAGLEPQTLGLRQADLPFTDASLVAQWSRGHIALASRQGLIAGLPDGSFRPDAPVTRAEGALILARLLMARGSLYHLSGTLVRISEDALTVRDPLGQEHQVALTGETVAYRGGIPVEPSALQLADQVWVMMGSGAGARFIEARYQAVQGELVEVTTRSVRLIPDGTTTATEVLLEPGALIFVNGRPASSNDLRAAQSVYLALNRATGEARVVDGVHFELSGTLIGVDSEARRVVLQTDTGVRDLLLAPDAVLVAEGYRVTLEELTPDDRLLIALRPSDGSVSYVERAQAR